MNFKLLSNSAPNIAVTMNLINNHDGHFVTLENS